MLVAAVPRNMEKELNCGVTVICCKPTLIFQIFGEYAVVKVIIELLGLCLIDFNREGTLQDQICNCLHYPLFASWLEDSFISTILFGFVTESKLFLVEFGGTLGLK